jgi:hypothetical protein
MEDDDPARATTRRFALGTYIPTRRVTWSLPPYSTR